MIDASAAIRRDEAIENNNPSISAFPSGIDPTSMDDQLPDLWQADELEQDDFAQFLAEFVQDPLLNIPDASIPGPELDFDCDDTIRHVSPSSCTAGALSSAALGPPAAQQSHTPPETNLNGREQPLDPKLEKIRAKNRRGQARYREKCKARSYRVHASTLNIGILKQTHAISCASWEILGQVSAPTCNCHTVLFLHTCVSTSTAHEQCARLLPHCVCNNTQHVQKQRQELEAAIRDRQETLSQLVTQARRLRDTRSSLLGRIDAAEATPHPPQPPPPPPLTTPAPLIRSTSHHYTIFGEQLTQPRPPSAFTHMCAVSYAEVAAHIPSNPPRSPTDPHGIVDALQSFLRATSNRLGCPPSDICFFVQLPFEAPPAPPGSSRSLPNDAPLRPLSHSAGVTSAPCCLTMSVAFLALSIEATFLVREHACLLEASTDTATSTETDPPDAEDLVASEAPVLLAPLPDAAACRRLVLRCGVGDTCPLHDALAALLPPLLRRYRTSLPHAVWRRVCLQAIRLVQSTLDGMSAKAAAAGDEYAETQGGDSGAEAEADSTEAGEGDPQEGEMCWEHLDVATKVAMEVMLHHLTAAVQEPAPQVCMRVSPWLMCAAGAVVHACMHACMLTLPLPRLRRRASHTAQHIGVLLYTIGVSLETNKVPPPAMHATLGCVCCAQLWQSSQGVPVAATCMSASATHPRARPRVFHRHAPSCIAPERGTCSGAVPTSGHPCVGCAHAATRLAGGPSRAVCRGRWRHARSRTPSSASST